MARQDCASWLTSFDLEDTCSKAADAVHGGTSGSDRVLQHHATTGLHDLLDTILGGQVGHVRGHSNADTVGVRNLAQARVDVSVGVAAVGERAEAFGIAL